MITWPLSAFLIATWLLLDLGSPWQGLSAALFGVWLALLSLAVLLTERGHDWPGWLFCIDAGRHTWHLGGGPRQQVCSRCSAWRFIR